MKKTGLLVSGFSLFFLLGVVMGSNFPGINKRVNKIFSNAYRTVLPSGQSTGSSTDENGPSGKTKGRFFKIQEKNSKKSEQNFKGLGYLSGYENTKKKGVTVHKPSKSWQGLNLYVSGHGPEATLVDMNGKVLHRWSYPRSRAFPGTKFHSPKDWWTKTYLYPNGDLLAIYDGGGLVKLSKNSKLRWGIPNWAHHDLWVSDQGKIYVLTRQKTKLNDFRFKPKFHEKKFTSDYVTVLSPEGEILRKYSILKAMKNSRFASLLKLIHSRDLFHTNTLEFIQQVPSGVPEEFQEGRAIISMRRLNFTGVMDLDSEKIVWGKANLTYGQHDPRLLPSGRLLIFDNRRRSGYSRILKVNPNEWSIEWELSGKTDVPFYSECCGRNQPLPNGNILITDTDSGRGFEVTPSKELVWEYYNPHRLEQKNNYIAAVYDMQRISKNYVENWLNVD